MIQALLFIKVALAVYRVAIMIATERAPFDLARRLRLRFGAETPPDPNNSYNKDWYKSNLQEGLSCPYCISFWGALVGALFLFLTGNSTNLILDWFALAGLAALFVAFWQR